MLPDPPPRPYGLCTVVVTGGESTGKTTLVAELAAHFGATSTGEHARVYALAKRSPLTAADVVPIARGQAAGEDAALASLFRPSSQRASAPLLLIKDTDLLSTVVYAAFYYRVFPDGLWPAVLARRGDLYLLCAADVPWQADGVRDQPAQRGAIQRRFRHALGKLGANVVTVRGGWQQRTATAIAAVEKLLHSRIATIPPP